MVHIKFIASYHPKPDDTLFNYALVSTVSVPVELFPLRLIVTPSISPPRVRKLALIEADSHKINKLNEAADIIHLAHVTCGY